MRRFFSILAVIFLVAAAVSCRADEPTVAGSFEEEYEILNGQSDMEGEHIYRTIDVPSENTVQYADLAQILSVIEDGTGIIYFGFPECPWCRTLVPVLFEAVAASGYDGPIYYCNFLAERDKKTLDENGNVVTEQEGSAEYAKLIQTLYDWIGPYNGLNDETIKRVYFPTTVFVKDGVVMDVHLVTVDSQESGYDDLSEEQHAELLSALTADIQMIQK